MIKTLKQAREVAGTLGKPSKMPCMSYGLPAVTHCNVGGKLAKIKGTTCYGCYAVRGNYQYGVVQKVQHKRLLSLNDSEWVSAMVFMIEHERKKTSQDRWFFRWHDSGDIQNKEHFMNIVQVCKETPLVQHWLPTREYGLVAECVNMIGEENIPENLTIRISATKIDGAPPRAWELTSTVHKERPHVGHECPAPKQNNECGSCRACWNSNVKNVSYKYH